MHKLIETKKGATTFTIKNETDMKLMSLALSIMADIERKGEEAKSHLNRKPYWIHNSEHACWWSFNDVAGLFFWGFTDALNPYDWEQSGDGCNHYYAIEDYSYSRAFQDFTIRRFAFYHDVFIRESLRQPPRTRIIDHDDLKSFYDVYRSTKSTTQYGYRGYSFHGLSK
jgi:hypothetical protein